MKYLMGLSLVLFSAPCFADMNLSDVNNTLRAERAIRAATIQEDAQLVKLNGTPANFTIRTYDPRDVGHIVVQLVRSTGKSSCAYWVTVSGQSVTITSKNCQNY